jgi:hypothetical protein
MAAIRKAVAALPQIFYAHLVLAGALGLKGDLNEAKAEIAEALRLKPEVTSLSKWREDLRLAGLSHRHGWRKWTRRCLRGCAAPAFRRCERNFFFP